MGVRQEKAQNLSISEDQKRLAKEILGCQRTVGKKIQQWGDNGTVTLEIVLQLKRVDGSEICKWGRKHYFVP